MPQGGVPQAAPPQGGMAQNPAQDAAHRTAGRQMGEQQMGGSAVPGDRFGAPQNQAAPTTPMGTDRTGRGCERRRRGHRGRHCRQRSHGRDASGREQLFPASRAEEYGARWDAVKGAFVDEPRQADALVGEVLDELERLFGEQRSGLEHGLDTDDTSTEDLRLALRRYRSFFDRLLSL